MTAKRKPKDEIEALRRRVETLEVERAEMERLLPSILHSMVMPTTTASALLSVCEELRRLLVEAQVPIPRNLPDILDKTKHLHDVQLAASISGTLGDLKRSGLLNVQASDAEILERSISAFGSPQVTDGLTDVIAERLAKHFSDELSRSLEFVETVMRKGQAKRGAAAKLANDPTQAAKSKVFELWKKWQSGQVRHRSGAAFDRYVVETFPAITATKTVERWRKEWSAMK